MIARLKPDINVRGKRLVRIGELARVTGASPRSLRYYEEQHLLSSNRSTSGQRLYTDAARERVLLIQRLYQAGLCSSTIAELLPCITDPAARTPLLRDRLISERARISAQVDSLGETLVSLDAVVGALGTGDSSD
nr:MULTISPECIES: MerR family transcriptional regulator [unclassified Cryobacterium]